MASLMGERVGRGIAEDEDAERPPLVFAMAEMGRGDCS